MPVHYIKIPIIFLVHSFFSKRFYPGKSAKISQISRPRWWFALTCNTGHRAEGGRITQRALCWGNSLQIQRLRNLKETKWERKKKRERKRVKVWEMDSKAVYIYIYSVCSTIFSGLWSSAYFSNILSHSSALTWRQWQRERRISRSTFAKNWQFPVIHVHFRLSEKQNSELAWAQFRPLTPKWRF